MVQVFENLGMFTKEAVSERWMACRDVSVAQSSLRAAYSRGESIGRG
jgi:hypothetical protein